MLDVYINGPGYGETIILRWEVEGKVRAGLIDCYAPGHGEALVEWLHELGIHRLEFLVATHPHLDHITNAYRVLRVFERRVDRVWWWGGLGEELYTYYFDRLAERYGHVNKSLGTRAKQVFELFKEWQRQWHEHRLIEVNHAAETKPLYPTGHRPDPLLRMHCLSPWPLELKRFVDAVQLGSKPEGPLQDNHQEANHAAIGLLVEYGRAQIVFGADVTAENWAALRESGQCPILRPCLVKVSHHGSPTGQAPGMWVPGGGFYEGAGSGSETPRPVAVVTPWNNRLPKDEVIAEIRRAGCKTYVTGQSTLNGPTKPRPFRSFVHLQVSETGTAEVVETTHNVTILDPSS